MRAVQSVRMLRCVFTAALLVTSLADTVEWWQTAEHTADRLSRQPSILSKSGEPPSSWQGPTITVFRESRHQQILGFGAAFTQASATVFNSLSAEAQEQLVSLYFGEDGIGYNMGRIPINSCDFSPKIYTFDDMRGDYNLTWFDKSLQVIDSDLMIPLINAALSVANSSMSQPKLFASPWSPPAWMKSNDNMLEGGELLPEAQAAWALYFSKWISAYNNKLKSKIWGVTVQNEPEASQPWESCVYNASYERDFVGTHLGPQLRKDHPDVKIMGFDHNKDNLVEWADTLLAPGSTAAEYIDGLAFHWYAGNCFSHIQQVASQHSSKFLLPTEATYELTVVSGAVTPQFVRHGNWSRGEGYAYDILGDLKSGAAGWIDWNLLLDEKGGPNHVGNDCDAAILANVSSNELYVHPQYWYMGHFSKFIKEGSIRLGTSDGNNGQDGDCKGWPDYGTCASNELQHTAFQVDSGTIVVVVLNCADIEAQFVLSYGQWFQSTAPAHSIQTYVLQS